MAAEGRVVSVIGSTGQLLRPSDPGYDDARRLWNAMLDKRPALIARCRSTADVVAAVDLAQGEGLEVAVRGGGHSVSGLSSTEGGVMIDLRPMNRVLVDPDRRRVRVQGGALLGELDRATHVFGLATPGGMVHHTGSPASPSAAATGGWLGSTGLRATT
jgi:FAD/FMN-containing dehydrogenase